MFVHGYVYLTVIMQNIYNNMLPEFVTWVCDLKCKLPIKTTNPFPHKLDVLPNCRLGCSGFYKNQKCKHIIGKKLC